MANVSGLATTWDADPHVRERLRQTGTLCVRPKGHQFCEGNRINCVNNDFILMPILRIMEEDSRKLPHLDPLKVEVAKVHHLMSLQVEEKTIYTTAVGLKRLCSFVKRRAGRKEVTKELSGCFWVNSFHTKFLFKNIFATGFDYLFY